LRLSPGDPLRTKFEGLVTAMGVSGAEVVRYLISAVAVKDDGSPIEWAAAPEEDIAKAS